MSAVIDSLLIVIATGSITGSFTIIGLVLGIYKEKWSYNREKASRQKETEEENRKNYLSPLYFHLNKLILIPLSDKASTFQDLKIGFNKFYDISTKLDTIEQLMKTNMHILPMELNTSLNFYITDLRAFINLTKGWTNSINSFDMRKTKVPKGVIENFNKEIMIYNDISIKLLPPIYDFMKSNVIPKKQPIPYDVWIEINEMAKTISTILESTTLQKVD